MAKCKACWAGMLPSWISRPLMAGRSPDWSERWISRNSSWRGGWYQIFQAAEERRYRMPTNMKDDIRSCDGQQEYTSTFATNNPEIGGGWSVWKKLRFYHATIKWLWAHRKELNNRHKWRRMMREVQE